MRITCRGKNIKQYWEDRWADIPADTPINNLNVHPVKFSEMTVKSNGGKIFEAGCGAGRLLLFYKNKGYKIYGMDFIKTALDKLKTADNELLLNVGDIKHLGYANGSFKYVLAFGLYHNLETGLNQVARETYRVLEVGRKVCASFRVDNIQTKIGDCLSEKGEARALNDSILI